MTAQTRKVVHADIKPENPPERAAQYVDAPNMPWEATKFPGIQIKVLYTDDHGVTTALFKLAPGAHHRWIESVVHNFAGPPDGALAYNGMVSDGAGHFFGATTRGGAVDHGAIYEFTP